jgi:hypothetical protein
MVMLIILAYITEDQEAIFHLTTRMASHPLKRNWTIHQLQFHLGIKVL